MIRMLSRYLKQYTKYAILGPLCVIIDVICEMQIPRLMETIVDVGIASGDIPFILARGAMMIGLALLAIGAGVLNIRFSSIASQGLGANVRKELFTKIQTFSFSNIDQFSTASLVTRSTTDINHIQMTLMMCLRILIRSPMMMAVALYMSFDISRELALVMLAAIPLLAVLVVLIIFKANPLYRAMQKKMDTLNRIIQENLIGIRVVKAFVREDFEKEKFKASNDDLTQASQRASTIASTVMPVMMIVLYGATGAVLWFGGGMVGAGQLGSGALIGFISYIMQILMSVMMMSMVLMLVARARASVQRVAEVLDAEVDIADPPQPAGLPNAKGHVVFKNVHFKYNHGAEEDVLSNIGFEACPGEVVAIVGGTGSAKTTLVQLIPRLYDVTEGAVLVDGVDVREYPIEELRSLVGIVLQKNVLFKGTIKENMRWGNEQATDEQITDACKAAQAHDFIMSFPHGYDTMLDQGGVNVSGGQKQRLCIARAMLKNPAILILDDSTSAVDTATEAEIRKAFYGSLKNTTVIIIAQRISSVQDADRILVLDDGRIAGQGTHDELMRTNEIYQEVAKTQNGGEH